MIIGFGNNTVSSLAADITANQTTIQVMPGEGAKFAKLLSSDYVNTSNPLKVYAKITLTDAKETVFEVCHLTAVNNDMLTVVRGQEGTTAKGWALNDVVANFATRGSENQFVQIEQLQSGNYTSGVAGGSANALTIELPATYFVNSSTDWALRTPIVVYPTQNNTGASTLQLVMGGRVLGTFPLYKGNKAQLVANDILKDVGLVCLMDKTKTFFNVANPGAIYAGLGTAAFKDVQKTVTDTTDGAVLVVGKSFGLGFGNVVNPRPDPSTFPPSGFYTASADDIGLTQLPGGYVGLITALGGTAYRNEIALEKAGRMFIRGADGANVPSKNWYECYTENHKPTSSEVGALPSNGNAVSASKLKTARNIAGVEFDGTKDIAISAADVGTYTKNEIDNKLGLKGNKSTANLGVSGWWRDGSTGLLIQWGTQRSVDANGVSFNYPIAFNAVYGGLATIKTNVSIDGNNAAYFFTPNLTTGTVVNDPATTGRVCDVFWVAFGA